MWLDPKVVYRDEKPSSANELLTNSRQGWTREPSAARKYSPQMHLIQKMHLIQVLNFSMLPAFRQYLAQELILAVMLDVPKDQSP